MTVGVAYRVPGQGAVLVSDGLITHDGAIISNMARKHVLCGSTVVLVAGEIGQLWRELQERPPRSFAAFLTAVASSSDDTDWLAYDRRSDRLWLGNARLSQAFATLGSGDSVALGALDAMPVARSLEMAEQTALRAVRITCQRRADCGGRIRTVVVPRRGVVSVK